VEVGLGVAGFAEEVGGAVGEGEEAWDVGLEGEFFDVLDELMAVAEAFVCLFDVEAGEFGGVLIRVWVEGDAADDVVIDGEDVVVVDFGEDVLVGAGDEFGAADGAADHA